MSGAVSLSDAWNETPDPLIAESQRAISARQTQTQRFPTNFDAEPHTEDEPIVSSRPDSFSNDDVHRQMLEELRALRMEQSRRCTVYLVVGGILFSMLFMYIDKLQSRIKILSSRFTYQEGPTGYMPARDTIRRPFEAREQWYG